MNFQEAQQDMRTAYFGGGPGIIASGISAYSALIRTYGEPTIKMQNQQMHNIANNTTL